MIIYRVPDLGQRTSVWVDLTNDAQKIEVAVYCYAFG